MSQNENEDVPAGESFGESFEDLYQEYEDQQEMKPGDVIAAEVVAIDDKGVIVNAGVKSEAFIDRSEFLDQNDNLEVQVGDATTVMILQIDDGYGNTKLSRLKAKNEADWHMLEAAMADGAVLRGKINAQVKGGLTVQINSVRAFLPGSLVDIRQVKDTSTYIGKEIDFKVIKLDKKRTNVVVSRKVVLEETLGEEREALLATLKEGEIIDGTVKNITDYGAFIELGKGGIDGLLHITDLAWRRVKHPSEILQVNQEIKAKVLKFDREKNRVSLGLKQLGEDPWNDLASRYPPKTRLRGTVSNLTDYGAFVEIEQGIEGLVHVSEMDWTNKNVHPSKVVHLGEEVDVMILAIDEDKRRISLGMKQCMPNPWEEFASNYSVGDRIRCQVKSITDFGIFVGLPGGIDGLVHITDLTWDGSGEEALRSYKKGDEVEVVILTVNTEKDRISLGIKQLQDDPFNTFLQRNEKGSIVTGTVTSIDPKGAVVKLAKDVDGYLRVSEIANEKIDDINSVLSEGQEIQAMITSIDRKNKSVSLSIKAKNNKERDETLKSVAQSNANAGTTSLADLLKDQLKDDDSKDEESKDDESKDD